MSSSSFSVQVENSESASYYSVDEERVEVKKVEDEGEGRKWCKGVLVLGVYVVASMVSVTFASVIWYYYL